MKLVVRIISALVILVLVLISVLQNMAPVELQFLTFQIEVSLALVLILTLVSGIIIGLILFLPMLLKKHSKADQAKDLY